MRRLLWRLNILALALMLGWLAWRAFPATEATRLRNAWQIEASVPADFRWTPDAPPAGFRLEDGGRDTRLVMRPPRADWEQALALAAFLTEKAADKGPIQADHWTTLQRIRQGYGYCSDFVEAFLPMAHANGLFAREWAFSFDGFGGWGHSVVEIWDRQRGQWVFLDLYNNVHAVDAASGQPLSVEALRERLKAGPDAFRFVRNGPGRMGYRHERKLLDYYLRGLHQWYLWWGNAVLAYEAAPAVRIAALFGRAPEQLAAILAGVHPRIRILAEPENQAARDAMAALRRDLTLWLALFPLLLVTLIWQWRRNPRP